MAKRYPSSAEILRYNQAPVSQGTVRRHYTKWRADHEIPARCDNPACAFHAAPLDWNGSPLPLILDHKNGNHLDNSPENLRFLCPNCDSQLTTRGGANRGRVEVTTENSYILLSRDGRRDHHVIPGPARLTLTEHVAAVITSATPAEDWSTIPTKLARPASIPDGGAAYDLAAKARRRRVRLVTRRGCRHGPGLTGLHRYLDSEPAFLIVARVIHRACHTGRRGADNRAGPGVGIVRRHGHMVPRRPSHVHDRRRRRVEDRRRWTPSVRRRQLGRTPTRLRQDD